MFGKLFGKKEKEIQETPKTSKADEIITGEVVGKESVVDLEPKETQETQETQEIESTTIDFSKPPIQEIGVTRTHNDGEQPQEPPPLTRKEMKALKRSNYETKIMNNTRFKRAYLIKNIRTGQIVEVRAASSFHACNIIGWKVNRVRILSEKDIKEEKSQPETVASSSNPT